MTQLVGNQHRVNWAGLPLYTVHCRKCALLHIFSQLEAALQQFRAGFLPLSQLYLIWATSERVMGQWLQFFSVGGNGRHTFADREFMPLKCKKKIQYNAAPQLCFIVIKTWNVKGNLCSQLPAIYSIRRFNLYKKVIIILQVSKKLKNIISYHVISINLLRR